MQWLIDHWSAIQTWLVTVVSSVVAGIAALGITYKFLAEKMVGHVFDRRLEGFKHERSRDLEQLKHRQNE